MTNRGASKGKATMTNCPICHNTPDSPECKSSLLHWQTGQPPLTSECGDDDPVWWFDPTGRSGDVRFCNGRGLRNAWDERFVWCLRATRPEPYVAPVTPVPSDAMREIAERIAATSLPAMSTGQIRTWAFEIVRQCKDATKATPSPETAPEPDPGEGWRLMQVGEVVQKGDEVLEFGVWSQRGITGSALTMDNQPHRRRVTPETPAPTERNVERAIHVREVLPTDPDLDELVAAAREAEKYLACLGIENENHTAIAICELLRSALEPAK